MAKEHEIREAISAISYFYAPGIHTSSGHCFCCKQRKISRGGVCGDCRVTKLAELTSNEFAEKIRQACISWAKLQDEAERFMDGD